MLAYVDGEVAGWCGFGVRPRLPRLERSRTIPKVDDKPVWAILCFGYVGLTPWFEQRGFRRVVETAARSDRRPRILMRLDLRG
jgi:hypothetical protein